MQRNIALVTGASRGIGRAIALHLAENGFDLAVAARNPDGLAALAAELEARGAAVHTVAADLTGEAGCDRVVDEAVGRFGRIDVLVNNAGRPGGGVTADVTTALWADVVGTNLTSVFLVTRAALRRGNLRPGIGAIINVASTGGKQGVVHGAPYSASKHAVVGFTKSLGLELAAKGITVNAVCPGFVETEMAATVRQNYARLWGVTVEDAKKRIEARVPIGRYVEPAEVAALVGFLASPAARAITAQAINVCGGLGNY